MPNGHWPVTLEQTSRMIDSSKTNSSSEQTQYNNTEYSAMTSQFASSMTSTQDTFRSVTNTQTYGIPLKSDRRSEIQNYRAWYLQVQSMDLMILVLIRAEEHHLDLLDEVPLTVPATPSLEEQHFSVKPQTPTTKFGGSAKPQNLR
ncbi:hypothetical protein EMPG_12401 [Blastomyces silverae]|uniref:Uncharacterized protein n=1 Tax=Blastomyces silverae TaxID=2060906 RepID=A0A0H1BN75_9EURO|nr:hypothetical protein EMPG_12401 [Blastomyces silverae]